MTYSTDREDEVSNIFIISLWLIGLAGNETFKVSGPYSKVRPAKLPNHTHLCVVFWTFLFFQI